ncbi:glutamate--cysteine ligase [Ruania suaedae]|uniref:glutamate--cysteine ligase n=1 Tax=Ruania suaedae TaxID=2897774 RepID=UPI001E3F3DB1|nr:glutamate--cysteine ligase [Ruania suaedae]UFU02361.1 glutamate--cysteine ligase [Ruania suaedae]
MTIEFSPSTRSTLGIEWELALVDSDTGDLRQVAQTVLDAVAPADGSQHPTIRQELLLNTVEIVSGVCRSVPEAMADLQRSTALVREITDPLRVELACAGTHPFGHWGNQRVTDKERYATLIDRTQWWGRQMLIYGVHVHVGIESRDKVLPILGALLTYYPHLLSLSASSPFWDGRDTGYASNRALLFQQLPTAGLPFTSITTWADLERYVDDMLLTGVIDEFDEVRWDLRPSPKFGTLEMRICDGISNALELAAVAALTHCLVEKFSRMIDAGEELPRISPWFLAENKWRSARYGMEAIIILDEAGNEELVTDSLQAVLADLAPIAADLGCAAALDGVREIIRTGGSAARQRVVAAGGAPGDLARVVGHLVDEFHAGRPIDPR